MDRWIRLFCFSVFGLGHSFNLSPAADQKLAFLRGAEFRRVWNNPVRGSLDPAPLHSVMQQLCLNPRLAWIIDRRLDPDQLLTCEPLEAPLSEFLPKQLKAIHADAVVLGDTVIVGPEAAIRWLRTLGEVQRAERLAQGGDPKLIQALGRPVEQHWDDLAQPRTLVMEVAERAKLELKGVESIPYDLWGSGDLVGLTTGEILTLLAWQYDLQLTWQAGGKPALVPLQTPVSVSRLIRIPDAQRDAVKSQFPELVNTPEGKSQRVIGRVEELEALEAWLKGGTDPRGKPKPAAGDWRTRKFKLKVENAPLIDILKRLKAQGIPIEWNEEALVAADVDLKLKLQFDLQNASIQELLSALCQPAGLQFRLTEQGAEILPP